MLQCFAGCEDPDVREAVRARLARPRRARRARSGEPPEVVSAFFAKGMLLTVLNAMQLFDDPTPWGDRLIAGCRCRVALFFRLAMKVTTYSERS